MCTFEIETRESRFEVLRDCPPVKASMKVKRSVSPDAETRQIPSTLLVTLEARFWLMVHTLMSGYAPELGGIPMHLSPEFPDVCYASPSFAKIFCDEPMRAQWMDNLALTGVCNLGSNVVSDQIWLHSMWLRDFWTLPDGSNYVASKMLTPRDVLLNADIFTDLGRGLSWVSPFTIDTADARISILFIALLPDEATQACMHTHPDTSSSPSSSL